MGEAYAARRLPVKLSPRAIARRRGGLDRGAAGAVDGGAAGEKKGDRLTAKKKMGGEAYPSVALGQVLEEHLAGWIGRVERTGHWKRKSDIHQRLMAEVEKIVIRAALEKTKYVQTDAADFLGINRNTLAKKIRAYGIVRA
jgi:DNA-binding protein Fis